MISLRLKYEMKSYQDYVVKELRQIAKDNQQQADKTEQARQGPRGISGNFEQSIEDPSTTYGCFVINSELKWREIKVKEIIKPWTNDALPFHSSQLPYFAQSHQTGRDLLPVILQLRIISKIRYTNCILGRREFTRNAIL
ncbi:Uncharacterized protein Rs2_14629 [Raphanus sativus]|nr:Uncharacterized protein Rs2_14629 [Raphanus sativus]